MSVFFLFLDVSGFFSFLFLFSYWLTPTLDLIHFWRAKFFKKRERRRSKSSCENNNNCHYSQNRENKKKQRNSINILHLIGGDYHGNRWKLVDAVHVQNLGPLSKGALLERALLLHLQLLPPHHALVPPVVDVVLDDNGPKEDQAPQQHHGEPDHKARPQRPDLWRMARILPRQQREVTIAVHLQIAKQKRRKRK